MFTSIKQKTLSAGVFGLLSLGSVTLSASPTYAAVIDFSTWNKFGDFTSTTVQVTLITAGNNALITGGGTSGTVSLEAALGIPSNSLVTNPNDINSPTQGSAIRSSLTAANPGDSFSFNLNLTGDSRDRAFVAITNAGNTITQFLTPSTTSFNYTFPSAGAYDVSIGALDVRDTLGQSQATVSNGNLQAVPEPISVISSIVALGCGAGLRKRFAKKS